MQLRNYYMSLHICMYLPESQFPHAQTNIPYYQIATENLSSTFTRTSTIAHHKSIPLPKNAIPRAQPSKAQHYISSYQRAQFFMESKHYTAPYLAPSSCTTSLMVLLKNSFRQAKPSKPQPPISSEGTLYWAFYMNNQV